MIPDYTPILNKTVNELSDPASYEGLFHQYRDGELLPSAKSLRRIVELSREILFPGYFGNSTIHRRTLNYHIGVDVEELFRLLTEQVEAGFCFGIENALSDESPEECLLREVKEETGLTLDAYRLRGVVTFDSDAWPTEYMFLYTADEFHGTMTECNEGTLEWVPKEEVYNLPIWEGDKIFFRLLEERESFFSLKLSYQGDTLTHAILDGTTRLK